MVIDNLHTPLVSCQWLKAHLYASNLIVLNATISKVDVNETDVEKLQIPTSRFFNLKKDFSLPNAPFPNTRPSETQFETSAQVLGINTNSAIVVYDDKGVYSSARVWWLFKSMGHTNVAVLDGGLPKWIELGYPAEAFNNKTTYPKGNFKARYNPSFFVDFKDVKEATTQDHIAIVDARSANRFNSLVPEPRKGLRSGTIPNSKNLPYTDLLDETTFKSKEEIATVFKKLNTKNQEYIFSCGSGITACINALAANLIGIETSKIYDGSWTEWGTLTNK
jgi:thiosulfate/3-mercaptopyruvate sulfurtransferase